MSRLVLFSHHNLNEEILFRYDLLKSLNPTWDIKPIGFSEYTLLPNSIVVDKSIYPKNFKLRETHPNHHVDWFDPDLFLYDGYLKYPNYDAYFLYEYDTICNTSIDSFFDTTLDCFGNNISAPANESWEWIERYRSTNPYHTNFSSLYAYGQSTCIYMKNHILKECVNELLQNSHLYDNMLSEIRGGTLISKFTTLKKGREDIHKYISWISSNISITDQIYFYHPVKL
jgi:hypothetical protein